MYRERDTFSAPGRRATARRSCLRLLVLRVVVVAICAGVVVPRSRTGSGHDVYPGPDPIVPPGRAASDRFVVGSAVARPAQFTTVAIEQSGFDSADAAAEAFGGRYGPLGSDRKVEYQAGIVTLGAGDFGYTSPAAGAPGADLVDLTGYWIALRAVYGGNLLALAHNHFDANRYFSVADVETAARCPLYLRNRIGELRYLDRGMIKRAIGHQSGPLGLRLASFMGAHEDGFPGACVRGCG